MLLQVTIFRFPMTCTIIFPLILKINDADACRLMPYFGLITVPTLFPLLMFIQSVLFQSSDVSKRQLISSTYFLYNSLTLFVFFNLIRHQHQDQIVKKTSHGQFVCYKCPISPHDPVCVEIN